MSLPSEASEPVPDTAPEPALARVVGRSTANRLSFALLLVAVLGLAGVLRLWHSGSGLPYMHYYDEPQTASRALDILRTGDFDPEFFNYGSLTIYLNAAVDVLHYFYLCGQPDDAVDKIRDVAELRTRTDTQWHWTFSHPSFLLWNRWLSALFGVASVALTFALGTLLVHRWAGLLAAALLACAGFHVEHSVLVTTDVPATTLMLAAIVASVLYARKGRGRHLVIACLCAGLAASTKYNAGLSVLAPLAALASVALLGTGDFRPRHGFALLLTPLAFLLGTPYALLNLPTFLKHAGYEVYHYKVAGHGAKSVEPGLEHARFQAEQLGQQLGPTVALLGAIGVLLLLARRQGWLALAVPVLFSLFMLGTRVNFHRNFLLLYPVLAVGAATTLAVLHRQLRALPPRGAALARAVLLSLVAAGVLWTAAEAGVREWKVRSRVETRSQAIEEIQRLADERGWQSVGIAAELHFHRLDLERLRVPYQVVPHAQLFQTGSPFQGLVCAQTYDGRKKKQNPEVVVQLQRMNAQVRPERVLARIEGQPLYLGDLNLSTDPGVVVLSAR